MKTWLLILLFAAGCDSEPEKPEVEDLRLIEQRGDQGVAEIARELELLPKRRFVDSMDLGTCYLWQGEYFRAAETYEVAARQAETKDALAAALYAKATAAGYAGHMRVAIDAADALVRLKPQSSDGAWLRLGLYLHTNDTLGQLVAKDHVMRLDPEASGHVVFDPVTTVVVGAVVVTGLIAATGVTMLALTPPDDRADVVVPMFTAVARVGGEAIGSAMVPSVGAIGLGQRIVGGAE